MSEQMWREVWNAAMQFKVATLPPTLTLDALMEVAGKLPNIEIATAEYFDRGDGTKIYLSCVVNKSDTLQEEGDTPQLALLTALHQAITS